jgi:hypothetical protein
MIVMFIRGRGGRGANLSIEYRLEQVHGGLGVARVHQKLRDYCMNLACQALFLVVPPDQKWCGVGGQTRVHRTFREETLEKTNR